MNRPHFRRRPRPTDPDPYTRLDRLDGLPGRVRECPECVALRRRARTAAPKWADLFGIDPEFPADQSGFTGIADWPVWDYGERYEIEPWPDAVVHHGSVAGCALCADLPDLPMVRAAATAYDLGLPAPLRSDPPIYRACLAGHGQATR